MGYFELLCCGHQEDDLLSKSLSFYFGCVQLLSELVDG